MASKVINPGKYKYKVVIRDAFTASRNSFGEQVTDGAVIGTVWAEKQDWSGNEVPDFERETANVFTKFIIRFRTDVLPKQVVLLNGLVYQINSVLDFDGTKRELVLMCQRVVQ